MSNDRSLLLATSTYAYLEQRFLAAGGYERGEIEQRAFPDGERYRRIACDVWGRDVVLLGGTPTDLDWLEVYDLGCAISRAGARSLSIVMPYFGYATMERAVLPGEVVTAKTRARLISAIPPCEAGTRVFLFDLHTDGIEFYFGDAHVTHHVYGAPIVTEAVKRAMQGRDYVLGATDAGRAKWVQSLAHELDVEPAFVYKRRDSASGDLAVTGVNADVRGREVMIYDDMIRTGGSLLQAARAYLDAGATKVHAIASHLVLPGDSLDELRSSGLLDSVLGTDSHPSSLKLEEEHVVSVVGLLVSAVARC
ncbi:MAG: ribose-phosphate pyrophosphokinase [Myxococcales bacterium]|nr:ribose-phosphate pyrophosphokinase [Myxococcales bacterium]